MTQHANRPAGNPLGFTPPVPIWPGRLVVTTPPPHGVRASFVKVKLMPGQSATAEVRP